MILTCKTRKQMDLPIVADLERQADEALRNMRRLIRAEELEIEYWFRLMESAPNEMLRALYQDKLDHQGLCLVRWRTLLFIAEVACKKRREITKMMKN